MITKASKILLSGYVFLTTFVALTYLSINSKAVFKSFLDSKLVTPKISSKNNKKWAKEIMNGGYILYFRHTEKNKWIDGVVYDALEASDNERFGEKEYFEKHTCLNEKGKSQAKAIN